MRSFLGIAGAAALAVQSVALPARAQDEGVSVVRDAEIEGLLQDYAAPLFRAAGIRTGSVEIFLVPDRSFNAFVADSHTIFINTGALLESERPNEIIGVLAHEIGHLADGHLASLRQKLRQTQVVTLIAALVGLGAVIGGAAAGVKGLGEAGGGVMAGIGEAGLRSVLAYARSEEIAADRAAIRFLDATKQSGQGMLDVFQRLADQQLFASRSTDPYLQSHPLPRERIGLIETLVGQSPYRDRRDPEALQHRHDLMRAKLSGYLETPQVVARRYPRGDNSLPARYARAVSAYQTAGLDRALPLIDDLIRTEPDNPFFRELKGQALLERGRAREAIDPLRRAVQLKSSSGLLRILLGHALVESGNARVLDEAIENLRGGLQRDPNVPLGYQILARAYASKGEVGMAQLATAQGLFTDGKIDDAKLQAARAREKLTRGSPGWLQADDIITYKPPRP